MALIRRYKIGQLSMGLFAFRAKETADDNHVFVTVAHYKIALNGSSL